MNRLTNGRKRKKFLPKLKGNLRLAVKRASVLIITVICLFFAFSKTDNLRAYFTDLKSLSNIFSIDAEYTVTFNSNTGEGTMEDQIISYNVETPLTSNNYTKTGYKFNGWNTEADGTGTDYTNNENVNNLGDIDLYAKWEKLPVKYAVQIYGINQDVNENDNTLGLTFGPATWNDYNNSYITHEYEETDEGSGTYYVKIVTHTVSANGSETESSEYLKNSSGENVTRTLVEKNKYNINMHDMTWHEIAAVPDKTVFLDCMLCGDTKSVILNLNNTLKTTAVPSAYGDGPGMLKDSIASYYRMWNPSSRQNAGATNGGNLGMNAKDAGAYSSSHIRATLIGENAKTNETYAGNVNLTTSNCLYTCLESDLKDVITAKKVKYITGESETSYSINSDIADKIWLFADREVSGIAEFSGNGLEGLGSEGVAYNRFKNTESKYYMATYKANGSPKCRQSYTEAGATTYWWFRSPYLVGNGNLAANMNGNIYSYNSQSTHGIAFGFCIDTIPINYTVKFNSNGGTGTMENQEMVSTISTALSLNNFTKEGCIFKEWNTKADGTGTSYTNGEVVTGLSYTNGDVINLYAQWKSPVNVKYAVQIYGINEDVDENGNPLGLTFGPATGDNFNNKYITHEYEETSPGSGQYYVKIVTHTVAGDSSETREEEYLYKNSGTTEKVTRTLAEKNKYNINMHNMTWEQIANTIDKTKFLDCMLCGDTKAVNLTLNSTLSSGGLEQTAYGDGAGTLNDIVDNYYRKWNILNTENSAAINSGERGSNGRTSGGYSASHIRATLIGKNNKTDETQAGDINLTTENCLFSTIENGLKSYITPKKVKYVTGSSTSSYSLNEDIADKIWLYSEREVFGTGEFSGVETEGVGTNGVGYSKFLNPESKYYLSSYNQNNAIQRQCFNENGLKNSWLLRSPHIENTYFIRYFTNVGSSTFGNSGSYYGYVVGISFGFCLQGQYEVTFNANGGTGTMSNQTITNNVPTQLNTNSFTKSDYSFVGWNTKADGTGTSYSDKEKVTNLGSVTLYAQWHKTNEVKYAVQIYGINQDEDLNGNTLGLTFGPATGENYNNKYVTHKYEETSLGSGEYYVKIVTHTVAANGTETTAERYLYKNGGTTTKVTRTLAEKNKYDINMHNMSWNEIAAVTDKTAFLDCMLCGDTKSVILTLNSTLASGINQIAYGDGAGIICNSIKPYYRMWNPSSTNSIPSKNNSSVGNGITLEEDELNYGSNAKKAGAYSSSHIRATLIGKNEKTNESYAGNINLSASTSLYSTIESDLKDVISAKKVKYVTGTESSNYSLNENIADKIWLFSQREMYSSATGCGNTAEGLGTAGIGYNKFGNNESKYYLPSYNSYATENKSCCNESGATYTWWLRSVNLGLLNHAFCVNGGGNSYGHSCYLNDNNGISFGFCIK